MKKIIFLLFVILILFLNSNVYAICDSADIERLEGIANNIQITYEHNVYGSLEDEEDFLVSVYDIVITGLTEEIYVIDDSGNKYSYMDRNTDGAVVIRSSSGERKIFVMSENCSRTLLTTKKINLPKFNFNSLSEECSKPEFKDLDICSEFLLEDEEIISGDQFEEVIDEVKKEQRGILYKIFDFLKNNILYVAIGLGIIIIVSIVLLIRYRRRNVLE